MSQLQELEAIDRLVRRFKPTNVQQQKLISDWHSWYPHLNFYQKNLDSTILNQAHEFRSALQGTFGADTSKIAGNFTKKGTQVPTPVGYRRAKQSEITPAVQGFAKAALSQFGQVSKKKGEAASIGMRYSAVVDGKEYLSQCEWHFDNHPKGGKGDPFWHMGSSIFVPEVPVSKAIATAPKKVQSMFRTSDPSLAALQKSSNPYA